MKTQQAFVMRWLSVVRAAVAAHVHEEGGNNLGAQVERYQRACGGAAGEPWCLYMQIFYALKEIATENLASGERITADNIVGLCRAQWPTLIRNYHIPITGSCGAACDFFDRHGLLCRPAEITEIKPGWLVFYSWTPADVANRIPRHVGMCDVQWKFTARAELPPILSLEGNTSGVTGDPSEGDSCYRKERAFSNVVAVARTY